MSSQNSEIKEFFDSWSVYQKFIEYNYMHHQELFSATAIELAKKNLPAKPRFLDLGCGDAYFAAKLCEPIENIQYTGIDLSEVALDYARRNLNSISITPKLIAGDISSILDNFIANKEQFDIIFSSFCIHHFQSLEDKKQLFEKIKQCLNQNGIFIQIDISLAATQTRKQYMNQTMLDFYSGLAAFSEAELSFTREHIEKFDYPENIEKMNNALAGAGFNEIDTPYQIKHYALFTAS